MPNDTSDFKQGKPVGFMSKDTHSKPVKTIREPGAQNAPKKYDVENEIETKAENKRKPGASEAPNKFEGSKDSVNKNTDQERKGDKFIVAKGAEKEFAEFRKKIRSALGLSLDSDLNKGNDGKLH
ncbi:MAG: hypothetical protein NZZ41_01185 [Candidatus Dojkabacteria bacterium]|nr:hypothetical protein [Candidatus Dojkabacteria bacterium]